MIKRLITWLTLLAAIGHTPWATAQQNYPEKPIRLIVPWSAGGPVDAVARAIAAHLSTRLGQPTFVENRPGASGTIGTHAAATSPADGHTVFVANVDTHVINPQVDPRQRHKPMDAFDPVVEVGRLPLVFVLRTGLAAESAEELVHLSRGRAGGLTYGSWGIGSLGHIAIAMLEQQAGIEMVHIPFQGGAPAQVQLLGGQIDALLVQAPWAIDQHRAGKVQILGATSAVRSRIFPQVPTLAEKGFPGYSAEQWVGLYLPKGSPANARILLNREVNEYLRSPQGTAALERIGFEATGGTPEELADRQRVDTARWGRVIRERNITASIAN